MWARSEIRGRRYLRIREGGRQRGKKQRGALGGSVDLKHS
jgi:hypothetical protein